MDVQARANDHLNSIIRSRCGGAAGLLLMEKIGGSGVRLAPGLRGTRPTYR